MWKNIFTIPRNPTIERAEAEIELDVNNLQCLTKKEPVLRICLVR